MKAYFIIQRLENRMQIFIWFLFFQAQNHRELSFKKGDIIFIRRQVSMISDKSFFPKFIRSLYGLRWMKTGMKENGMLW